MGDCNYVMEGWDWDNLFPSSLLDQDTSITSWHRELDSTVPLSSTPTEAPSSLSSASHLPSHSYLPPSSSSSLPVRAEDVHRSTIYRPAFHSFTVQEDSHESTPATASTLNTTNTSEGSSDYNHDTPTTSQVLPRKNLPNTPSNPVTTKKKKNKRDPRLECPNFIAGRIPCACPGDDELEVDVEAEAVVKKRTKLPARCQVPSCGEDISHLKGYHQRHRVCLTCANSPKVMLKDQPHRYCQQCGKFHRISDFDEGKRSCRRKLERHNKRRRRRPADEAEAQEPADKQSEDNKENTNVPSSTANTGSEPAESSPGDSHHQTEVPVDVLDNTCSDDRHESDDTSENEHKYGEDLNFDDQSWLTMLMDGSAEVIEPAIKSLKQISVSTPETPWPSSQTRNREYVSPCPTGRVSFKLYDWNPADFPRRLRQQIFEWLANMPVELEGYIRSGCIILTFFIALPQDTWENVLDDWSSLVQKLLLSSESRVLGKCQILTQKKNKSMFVEYGNVKPTDYNQQQAPCLLEIYPPSLEAGCCTQIYVCGYNFCGARLLLSFGEQYIECSDLEPVICQHFTVWQNIEKIQVRRTTVSLPDSPKYGPAFVEVENTYGISNFLPVLVADNRICKEINAFGLQFLSSVPHNYGKNVALRYNMLSWYVDVLIDLGWTLRYTNDQDFHIKEDIRETLIERFKKMLVFSLEHDLYGVGKHLIQIILNSGILSISASFNTLELSKDSKNVLVSKIISSFNMKTEQSELLSSKFTKLWEISDKLEDGSGNLIQGLQGLEDLEKNQRANSMELNNLEEGNSSIEVSNLEETDPLLDDGLRKTTYWDHGSSWSRKPTQNLIYSRFSISRRRAWRIAVGAVSVATVCAGVCVLLQHPHEVVEISMSLRRCLWGPTNSHV